MTVWQLAPEACSGWSARCGHTCAAGPQPSGRPCVGRHSEGHSRHQMGQDGVFRRNWLKLLTASTVSSCGHASIPHIRTALPFFFFLVCLSGLSSTFQTKEASVYFYMRAMKIHIELQLPKWARLLRVKFEEHLVILQNKSKTHPE